MNVTLLVSWACCVSTSLSAFSSHLYGPMAAGALAVLIILLINAAIAVLVSVSVCVQSE